MTYYINHTKNGKWYVYRIGYGPDKYFDTQAKALEYQAKMNRLAYLKSKEEA